MLHGNELAEDVSVSVQAVGIDTIAVGNGWTGTLEAMTMLTVDGKHTIKPR